MGHRFYGQTLVFRPKYLADIFLKMNALSQSPQRKNLTAFVPIIKCELSSEN